MIYLQRPQKNLTAQAVWDKVAEYCTPIGMMSRPPKWFVIGQNKTGRVELVLYMTHDANFINVDGSEEQFKQLTRELTDYGKFNETLRSNN